MKHNAQIYRILSIYKTFVKKQKQINNTLKNKYLTLFLMSVIYIY